MMLSVEQLKENLEEYNNLSEEDQKVGRDIIQIMASIHVNALYGDKEFVWINDDSNMDLIIPVFEKLGYLVDTIDTLAMADDFDTQYYDYRFYWE